MDEEGEYELEVPCALRGSKGRLVDINDEKARNPRDPAAPMLPLRILKHSETVEEADKALWNCGSAFEFVPPFQVVLAPFGPRKGKSGGEAANGQDEEEGVLLKLVVTHMLSDGYSVVPLLSDLSHLVSQAEAKHSRYHHKASRRPWRELCKRGPKAACRGHVHAHLRERPSALVSQKGHLNPQATEGAQPQPN